METSKTQISKLFVHTAVDLIDEFEEKYDRAFQYIQQVTAGLSDKEFHDLLTTLVSKEKQHEDISIGLVYIILTDVALAPKTYLDLTLLTRDGLTFVTNNLAILVAEKYQKLSEVARKQLLWLLKEFVKNQVQNVDTLVWNILRQASGGDISARNISLIEGLLDIFIEYRLWLEKYQFLIGAVAYTFVRLIEDHNGPQFTHLRNKEVKFTISLIRDRFLDIIPLGRDFVRLLQNVARIAEFELLWKDILINPKSLCPTFNGIWQLLQTRTSRRFLQCRITPDVERKLHFLTSSVKFGNHKRYQDWFQERYFTTPESHSLRSDLIRFIINAIHPTNDMLCSDIIPRWAIIGWLLTSCTNSVASANAKLAIFYDWLFFDPMKDNIMNVEPGILVMYHSIKNHPLVSSTLLDFLCRIMRNFYPKGEDKIRIGVYNTLKKILEKQVIPNLYPLFESPKLDRELRAMIRENFREFCSNSTPPVTPVPVCFIAGIPMGDPKGDHISTPVIEDRLHSIHNTPSNYNFNIDHNDHKLNNNRVESPFSSTALAASSNNTNDAKFSDDEDDNTRIPAVKNDDLSDDDDIPLSKVRLKEKPTLEKVDLPSSIREPFEKFVTSKSIHDFESFLSEFRTGNVLDSDQETYVFEKVTSILKTTLPEKSIFPESKNDEKLSESIVYPIFGLFKVLYQYEEKCKKCILDLLIAVNNRLPSTGYLLLYFLKVYAKLQSRRNQNSTLVFKTNVYKLLSQCIASKVEQCLEKDLSLLEKSSAQMFLWLLPDIYREFKSCMINNSDVLKVLVGCVDAKNLRDLIYSVTQGKLVIFKNDGIIDVLRDSLDYETFEQFCIWQLVQAHDVPIEFYQDILPELEASNHAEALTYLLLMLKTEKPTNELIRLLLSRETKNRGDPFVTSALRYWCQEFEGKLSEIIASLLTSKYPTNSPNKRKRPLKNSSQQNSLPTSEQLLNHLEHFRRSCRHGNGTGTGLYVQNDMQRALQQAFSHSTDSQKKQFSDLFALAAEDETTGTRRGTSSRGRKAPQSKKDSSNTANSSSNSKKNSEPINHAYSSEESSDEDWSKQKTAKRRKKAISDSD